MSKSAPKRPAEEPIDSLMQDPSAPTTPPSNTIIASDNISPPDTASRPLKRTLAGEMKDEDSGYSWEKEEDAPGYAWTNAKSRDEAMRAWASVVEKDRKVGNRFGDVLLK